LRKWLKENRPDSQPKTDTTESWQEAMAWAIFYVEKECGQRIEADYPWTKFVSLFDHLREHNKREREEANKRLNNGSKR